MVEFVSSLSFLWELLRPVISNAMDRGVKPRVSADIARDRALHLYNVLDELNITIGIFVLELETFVNIYREKKVRGEPFYRSIDTLKGLADELFLQLKGLSSALKDLSPQLEIFGLRASVYIEEFYSSEVATTESTFFLLPRIYGATGEYHAYCLNRISAILKQATENRDRLNEAIEEFRVFISKEFSFKESFPTRRF